MNQLLLDPTQTTMLRHAFLRQMQRRFTAINNAVIQLLIGDDAFGYKATGAAFIQQQLAANARGILTTNAQQYKFLTDPQKLEAFQKWLGAQVDQNLLVPQGGTDGKPWTAQYIESAHLRGITNSYIATKTGLKLGKDGKFQAGSQAEFLRNAFSHPEQLSKLALLSTRSFENLKGITADMSAKMSNILAEGLANGHNPNKIASELSKQVGISLNRARTLARTEIIHAHAEGQLDGFELLGVDEVGILAEWSTAGDGAVCPLCLPKQGTVYTIAEARGLIPLHPNCVAPWTLVDADGVLSGLRVLYTGKIIEVSTANGRVFAVTPNHVMLSEFGFIQAKFLYNGLHLVNTGTTKAAHSGPSTPNKDNSITSIADVYASLLEACSSTATTVPAAPKDLHGEGQSCQSEIHIVRTNSKLGHACDKAVLSGTDKIVLVGGEGADGECVLPAGGTLAQFIKRVVFASDSSVGTCRDDLAFFLGALLKADSVGLAAGTRFNTCIHKPASYHTACYASLFIDALNTHPILKHLHHLFHWDFDAGTCVAIEGCDPGFFKSVSNSVTLDAELVPHSGAGDTVSILLDEIVDIQIRHYSNLYVYDLTTTGTVYALDGIIASNCRCSWKPALAGKGKKKPAQQPTEAATTADTAYQQKIAAEAAQREADAKAARAAKRAEAKAKKQAEQVAPPAPTPTAKYGKGFPVTDKPVVKATGDGTPEQKKVVEDTVHAVLGPHGIKLESITIEKRAAAELGGMEASGYGEGRLQITTGHLNGVVKTADEIAASRRSGQRYAEFADKEIAALKERAATEKGTKKKATLKDADRIENEKRLNLVPWGYVTDFADPLVAATAHEAGHALDNILQVEFPTAVRGAIDAGKMKSEEWYGFTMYGASHPAEMFAEITAAIHAGHEDKVPVGLLYAYKAAIETAKKKP